MSSTGPHRDGLVTARTGVYVGPLAKGEKRWERMPARDTGEECLRHTTDSTKAQEGEQGLVVGPSWLNAHVCGCGWVFEAEGTLHGHPAALWQLLAHRAAGCTVEAV